MNKIYFRNSEPLHSAFFPFSLTRKVENVRIGILQVREKWELALGAVAGDTEELSTEAGALPESALGFLLPPNLLPVPSLVGALKKLQPGEALHLSDTGVSIPCFSKATLDEQGIPVIHRSILFEQPLRFIDGAAGIFFHNAEALALDFQQITQTRISQTLPQSNRQWGAHPVFIEAGAVIEHCLLNTTDGPIYIGHNALVMEGSMLRGPLSIGEGATVKMGSRIYGATTLGPYCVGGGEIKNAVMFGYSNKAHDGYLGDSVLGEWCNLGAGTSNSNLKNNASDIRVYNPEGWKSAGIKCGVLMGDYSRTAINTSINTGTVIGVSANVFGAGLTPKYIPSFSWGSSGEEKYEFDKALTDIRNWMRLKGKVLEAEEISRLESLYRFL